MLDRRGRRAARCGAVLALGLAAAALTVSGAWADSRPSQDAPPKVSRLPIIDQAIEHHGGALYEQTATSLEMCSKSGCFQVRVDSDATGQPVFDVSGKTRQGLRRVRVTATTVQRWLDGTPVVVPTEDAQPLRDWAMARVYFCFLPYRLNDPSVFKQDLGLVTWGDRSLHKVKVTFAPGSSTDASDEYLYWLDPETGRVELFAYSYETGGGGLRFRRTFNHRRVGGLLFFDQENLGFDGPGLTLDALDADTVAQRLRAVSTVELRNIQVESRP